MLFSGASKRKGKNKGKHIFLRQNHGHMKSSNLTTIGTAKTMTHPYCTKLQLKYKIKTEYQK